MGSKKLYGWVLGHLLVKTPFTWIELNKKVMR